MSSNYGLCMTCKNAPTCAWRGSDQRPVLRCEEFDGSGSAAPGILIEAALSLKSSARASGLREQRSGDYKGLCANCEDRASCTFEKPEGGVWHCEEYR